MFAVQTDAYFTLFLIYVFVLVIVLFSFIDTRRCLGSFLIVIDGPAISCRVRPGGQKVPDPRLVLQGPDHNHTTQVREN